MKPKSHTPISCPHGERFSKSDRPTSDGRRIAYQWLDAQAKVKEARADDWKHLIERWGGRYTTDEDVKQAANDHPDVHYKDGRLNISRRLKVPSEERLADIRSARTMNTYSVQQQDYRYSE